MNGGNPLPKALQRALAERKVFNLSGGLTELHSNVSESEAIELYRVVRALEPQLSLEVGFAQGVSTLAILQAIDDIGTGNHHVMDPYQDQFEECGLAMVGKAGLGHRMTFHRKYAEEVIPGLPEIGFAFIDASHLFDLTLSEFVLTDKKLRLGGVVALHDMWMPSQQAVVRYLLANRNYRPFAPKGGAPLPSPPPDRLSFKRFIRRLLGAWPGAERFFSREFLHPWSQFGFGNLLFLQKTEDDHRDWRFHQRF